MNVIDIKNNTKYLKEYCILCNLEWGSPKINLEKHAISKSEKIQNNSDVISILGLIDNDILIGFISLLKRDGCERLDLSPWYATLFVKKEYRGNGYSKLLNDALIKRASELGYKRLYLKTNLINYYEKFGAIYIDNLASGEKLYYIDSKV